MGLVIKKVYEPLSWNVSMTVEGSVLEQEYKANGGLVSPDRRFMPTVIVPVVNVVDRAKVLPSGRANHLLVDVKWYENEVLIGDDRTQYRVNRRGKEETRGALLVRKNLQGNESVVLRFSAMLVDMVVVGQETQVRRKALVVGSVVLKCGVSAENPLEIRGHYPNGAVYDPIKGLTAHRLSAELWRGTTRVPSAYWWYKLGGADGNTETLIEGMQGEKRDTLLVPTDSIGKEQRYRVWVQDCSLELRNKAFDRYKDSRRNYVLNALTNRFDTVENTFNVGHWIELSPDFLRDLNERERKVVILSAEVDFDIDPSNDQCHFGIDVKFTNANNEATWGWFGRRNPKGIFKDTPARYSGRHSITMDLGVERIKSVTNVNFFTVHCQNIRACRIWDVKFEIGDSATDVATSFKPSDEELRGSLVKGVELGADYRPTVRSESRSLSYDFVLGTVFSPYRHKLMTEYGSEDVEVKVPPQAGYVSAWVQVDGINGTIDRPERIFSAVWSDGVRGLHRLIDMATVGTDPLTYTLKEDLSAVRYGNGNQILKNNDAGILALSDAKYICVDFYVDRDNISGYLFSANGTLVYRSNGSIYFQRAEVTYRCYLGGTQRIVKKGGMYRVEVRGTDIWFNGLLVSRMTTSTIFRGDQNIRLDANTGVCRLEVDDHLWDFEGATVEERLRDKGTATVKYDLVVSGGGGANGFVPV